MKKILVYVSILASSLFFLTSCSVPQPLDPNASPQTEIIQTEPDISPSPSPTPSPTPAPTPTPAPKILHIKDGAWLERDIIPQIAEHYQFPERVVMDALAKAPESELISPEAEGFRRMEGILPVGELTLEPDTDLPTQMILWVEAAEERYKRVSEEIPTESRNSLEPYEHLILASLIEAEALHNEDESIISAVMQNRLRDRTKLQTCVSAEYALGYQRPFLTNKDMEVDSPYSTYAHLGLPPGPVGSLEDVSLVAAIQSSSDEEAYFYFYNYVKGDMQIYSDYTKFRSEATASQIAYEDHFGSSPFGQVNKQEMFLQSSESGN